MYPRVAKFFERVLLQGPFNERENDPLLSLEVFARRSYRRSQKSAGFLEVLCRFDLRQPSVNLFMIFIQTIKLPALRKHVIQGCVGLVFLPLTMVFQQALHQIREELRLRQRFQRRQTRLDLIEHGQKNAMLDHHSISNREHILY